MGRGEERGREREGEARQGGKGKRTEAGRSQLHQSHGVCCISGRLCILRGPYGQQWLTHTVGCSLDVGNTWCLKQHAETTSEVK